MKLAQRSWANTLVLGAFGAVTACSAGEAADSGDDDPGVIDGSGDTSSGGDSTTGSTDPMLEPIIPLDIDTVELHASCFEVEGPTLQQSVAPEGQLWLRLNDRTWRVLDTLGHDQLQELPATVEVLHARSADRALVIDEGAVWDMQAGWPQPLAWPSGWAEPTQMCGDPTRDANGFIMAGGLLHRDGGLWWEWTDPSEQSWADVGWMASNAGACVGRDGELWLSTVDGEAWRIGGDFAARVEALDDAEEGVLVQGVGVAARLDGDLVIGDRGSFESLEFESGPVSSISAGGDALWVMAGDRLHRLLDGEYEAVTLDGEWVQAQALYAEAGGGVWALSGEQICHLRSTSPVHIEGVHNLQRVDEETVEVSVRVSTETVTLTATLDGMELAMETVEPGRWQAEPVEPSDGWHELEVVAHDPAGTSLRRSSFEQRDVGELTWTGDVEPLFQEHCSGSACHSADMEQTTRPDLSTWEAWLDREDAILERVVSQGDMPPAGAGDGSWGLDQRLMVSEWFETGAQAGGE